MLYHPQILTCKAFQKALMNFEQHLSNRGIDGFVSQMVSHLSKPDDYAYCILLDLFMIEHLLIEFNNTHITHLRKALNIAKTTYNDKIVIDSITRVSDSLINWNKVYQTLYDVMNIVAELAKLRQQQAVRNYKDSGSFNENDVEERNAVAHTEVEKEIQDEILNHLQSLDISFDIIAEENTQITENCANLNSPHTIIIDPIDYTRDYVEGGDNYAVTTVVVTKGVPIIAVIEFPMRNEYYLCRRGCGVERIRDQGSEVYSKSECNSDIIVANKEARQKLKNPNHTQEYTIEGMNFTLDDILRCANGKVAAVLCHRIKAYDIAPAAMLAWEVGLHVANWKGKEILFDRSSLTADLTLPNGCIVAADRKVAEKVLKCFNV